MIELCCGLFVTGKLPGASVCVRVMGLAKSGDISEVAVRDQKSRSLSLAPYRTVEREKESYECQ